jgi:hypothetical protein
MGRASVRSYRVCFFPVGFFRIQNRLRRLPGETMRNTHIASYSARIRPSRYSMVVFSLIFMSLSGGPNCIEAASGEKLEALPVQKAAPAAVVIETAGSEAELRRQMRTKNGVTELRVGRARFSDIPTGSYGFIAPTHLGLALVTQSPDLNLGSDRVDRQ